MSTTNAEKFSASLCKAPIIAILRGVTPESVIEVAEALTTAGIRLLEVPLNSPSALESISKLSSVYGGRDDIHIGAGTVLNAMEERRAAKSGSTYIVSPNTNASVIRDTKKLGLISIPGFYTPTEAFAAIDAGADYLKLFPARDLGVRYIKDIKAVVNKPFIAVGGVDIDNFSEFLTVCVGVGIGSNLYSPKKSVEEIRKSAEEYMTRLAESPSK